MMKIRKQTNNFNLVLTGSGPVEVNNLREP